MSAFVGVGLLVISVLALMKLFALGPRTLQAVRTSVSALEVMHSPGYGDDRKEVLLQAYSLSLLRAFVDLSIRGLAAVAIPVGLLWTLQYAGLLSLKAVWDLSCSWTFLLGSFITAVAAYWLLEK
jgi:hypothetical protein